MKARNNPFRTARILEVRYRPHGDTLESLVDRLKELGYRGAIIGPNGTGKTTLLEDMEAALERLGFRVRRLRLDDQVKRFSRAFLNQFLDELTARDVIMFDGAEQMSRLAWSRFKRRTRKAGGLVITSHRPGMLPTLKQCDTSPELLSEIMGELLECDAIELSRLTADLHERHHGNLRAALRELYDVYAHNS